MLNHERINRLYLYSALLFSASLTLLPILASISFVIFIISSVLVCIVNKQYVKINKHYILFIFPFLVFLFSSLYTPDIPGSFKVLSRSISIGLLPILIAINIDYIKEYKPRMLTYYLYGLVLSSSISLFIGFYNFFTKNLNFEYFTYYELAEYLSLHPTYYSLFLITGIIFLNYEKNINRRFYPFILILFISIILLLQSRIAYIILILILTVWLYKKLKTGKSYLYPFLVITVLAIMFVPKNLSRLKQVYSSFEYKSYDDLISNNKENGVSQRIWLWSNAVAQIKEKPLFGYGLRSQRTTYKWKIQKENLFKNDIHNYERAAIQVSDLNLHNQYLQFFYEAGIIGLSLIMTPIILLMRKAYEERNKLFLIIFSIFITILFTENLLDRQMGIYFYSFILPILFSNTKSK